MPAPQSQPSLRPDAHSALRHPTTVDGTGGTWYTSQMTFSGEVSSSHPNVRRSTTHGRRRRLTVILAFALLALPTTVTDASGITSDSPSPLFGTAIARWPAGSSLAYCRSDSVNAHGGWASYIAASVSKWNGVTSARQPRWHASTGSQTCATSFTTSALSASLCGLTTTSSRGGQISTAVVRYSTSKTYDRGNGSGTCNFDWTTLHEFGHANGLRHSYLSTAVMYANDNGRTAYQTDDIYSIRCSYPVGAPPSYCGNNNPAP